MRMCQWWHQSRALDLNGSGSLEDGEVSSITYVCNGSPGDVGSQGDAGADGYSTLLTTRVTVAMGLGMAVRERVRGKRR